MTTDFHLSVPQPRTPRAEGYSFPAEWTPHIATWLSWPHNPETWPGKINSIYPVYCEFVRLLSTKEEVHINVNHGAMRDHVAKMLTDAGTDMARVFFHLFPTNDAWCRDHGPAFVVNPQLPQPKAVVKWGFNAWGDKYPPFDLDNEIPVKTAGYLGLPLYRPGIIMEGGSIEVNGEGTLLTTTACLLNSNRNPHLSKTEIEQYLCDYYGQKQILWLGDGIVGDDTDGHVDDLTRFVNRDTVVTVVESNRAEENYAPLQENLHLLKTMRLHDGTPLNVIELPMPEPVWYDNRQLPASYANFYIANGLVIVPTFRCAQDKDALDILTECFPDRKVVGLDSTDIVWGLGSFHCLSQQEPDILSE